METPEVSIVQKQVALRLLPIPACPAHLEITALLLGLSHLFQSCGRVRPAQAGRFWESLTVGIN